MKSFIVACIALVAIAIGAALALDHYQKPADAAFKTTAVRI